MAEPTLQPEPVKARTLTIAPPRFAERVGRYLPRREQLADFLKTFVWVAPLTLLIWVYAEREQSITQANNTVLIDVGTGNQDRLVTLKWPTDKMIIVELSGSRASLDRALERLKPAQADARIKINVDEKLGTGSKELDTVRAIENDPVFVKNGISVKAAQPPYLIVSIDPYEERDVPVRAPAAVANLLAEGATPFLPGTTVRLRAPSEMLRLAEAAGPLFVEADLEKRDELKTPGQVTLKNVAVYWPGHKENVRLTPETVTATVEVKPQDQKFTIKSLSVNLETPADFNDNYKVTYAATIPNVDIVGPAEQIEKIKNNPAKFKARLEVSSFDATRKPITRRLQFDLPQGVTLTPESAEKMQSTFTVEGR